MHKSVLLLHLLSGIFLPEAALLAITLEVLLDEKYCENNLPWSYPHAWNLPPQGHLQHSCLCNAFSSAAVLQKQAGWGSNKQYPRWHTFFRTAPGEPSRCLSVTSAVPVTHYLPAHAPAKPPLRCRASAHDTELGERCSSHWSKSRLGRFCHDHSDPPACICLLSGW